MSSRTLVPLPAAAAARPLPDVAALAGFRPTAAQRRFVQLAVAAQTPLRIAAVCEQLGIARSTYYRWLEQPGFRAWMSLQWASALLADGGRLLSIARVRAETDFRYWRALVELIFDPRGLGLLAAWQQRMMGIESEASASPAPLFTAQDSKEEPEFEERLAALEEPDAAAPHESPNAEPAASPEASTEIAPVAPVPPMESITCASATQQNAAPLPAFSLRQTEDPPSPCVPRIPPPWPSGGGRFQY